MDTFEVNLQCIKDFLGLGDWGLLAEEFYNIYEDVIGLGDNTIAM
jgi:hypothetical protein